MFGAADSTPPVTSAAWVRLEVNPRPANFTVHWGGFTDPEQDRASAAPSQPGQPLFSPVLAYTVSLGTEFAPNRFLVPMPVNATLSGESSLLRGVRARVRGRARGVHAGAQHGAPTGAHTLPGFLLLLSCLPSRETARSNWVMLSAETPGLQLPSSAACLTACITAANALGLRSAPVCSPLQFLPLPSVAGMPAATRLCVAEEV